MYVVFKNNTTLLSQNLYVIDGKTVFPVRGYDENWDFW